MGDAIHVAQLRHRSPSAITFAPTAARRQPDCEGFREIFIGMLLCVPACEMTNVVSRERYGAIIVEVSSTEGPEQILPFRISIELVRVVERVPSLMPQIHHDLALIFEIIHLFLQRSEFRIRKVKRNTDHGLARRASPFVREIAGRPELRESLAAQLRIELVNEALDRRAF